MIKRMFWPLIKRFKGLFISMVFVSMLSLGLLMAFTNIYLNLQETYHHYNNTYHAPTVTVTTNFHDMHEDIDNVKKIEGVDKAEYRLTFDCYMKKDDG